MIPVSRQANLSVLGFTLFFMALGCHSQSTTVPVQAGNPVNEHNVYLHSTPAESLFSQSRRDFSLGCIRLEKPAELAAWLLQDQPKWTLDAVKAAMQSGPNNQQVNLKRPVPVVIIHLTAVVEEDGEVYFFDDIYGHDRSLNAVLGKGPPYL